MNNRVVVSACAGVAAILVLLGSGWLIAAHQLRGTEARISRAVSFGVSPGKALPDVLFGEEFLAGLHESSALVASGVRYQYAVGVDANLAAARESYKQAADQGDPVGELMLGRLYDDSVVKSDPQSTDDAAATTLYERAAAHENTAAMDLLGDHFLKEERTAGNAARAVEWYARAATLGDPDGEYRLGKAYSQGDGLAKDEAAGLAWLKRSAAQGYGPATSDPALSQAR